MPALATQLAGGRVFAFPSLVEKRTASAAKKLSLPKNLPSALLRKPTESTARPMEALLGSARAGVANASNHLMELYI